MTTIEPVEADTLGDPYREYRFRLMWKGGQCCAGFSRATPVERNTSVIRFRPNDGDPTPSIRLPEQGVNRAVGLERGITCDSAFRQWADEAWNVLGSMQGSQVGGADGRGMPSNDQCKDFTLEVYDEADQKVLAYDLVRCWPSEFSTTPELDPRPDMVSIDVLVLENEGWKRDGSAAGDGEPSFALPMG